MALGLDGAVEASHMNHPDFRVNGKIFATLWTDEQLNVMLPGGRIEQVVADEPDRTEPVHWGKKLAAVRVHLPEADEELVEALLAGAWQRRT